jgi:DNA-binding CsgD family transcriptional regulator
VVALAGHLLGTGELEEMTELLEAALAWLPSGTLRGRALLMLADNNAGVDRTHALIDEVLAQAGDDPLLRADALAFKAFDYVVADVAQLQDAQRLAAEARRLAQGDAAVLSRALAAGAWVAAIRGEDPVVHGTGRPTVPGRVFLTTEFVRLVRHIWRGELEDARTQLSLLLADAEERSEAESYFALRMHACSIEVRAGDLFAAAGWLEEWEGLREESVGGDAAYARCASLVAAGRGDLSEARALAKRALEHAYASNMRWQVLEALRAQGVAALYAGELEAARAALGEVWDTTRAEGVGDPGAFPVALELIEALAGVGRREEAGGIAQTLARMSTKLEHPWGLAAGLRARAALASTPSDALHAYHRAAAAFARLGMRHEQARALLAAGELERRQRRRGAARESLALAQELFEACGAPGWAEQAAIARRRVGGREPAGERLTATEERVARLVASGLTNREVAGELVVSVRAVEANLSRIYAKLGLRSRTELAALLGAADGRNQSV